MTEKRFTDDGIEEIENQSFTDNLTEKTYWIDNGLDEIVDLLNTLHEEKETYKRLFNEMAYYFRDNIKSLNDLDHKDFESLQLLAQGEYFDEESLCWCKVQLEEIE